MKEFKNDIVKITFEQPVIEFNATEENAKMIIDIKDINLSNVGVVNFNYK